MSFFVNFVPMVDYVDKFLYIDSWQMIFWMCSWVCFVSILLSAFGLFIRFGL